MSTNKQIIKIGQEELWGQRKVSDELGLSIRTLENWRAKRVGPAFLRLGAQIYYKVSAIEEWINSQQAEMPDS